MNRFLSNILSYLCIFLFSLGIINTFTEIQSVEAINFQGKVEHADNAGGLANKTTAANDLYDKIKAIVAGITGLGALTLLAILIKRVYDLGATAHNAKARSDALMGILTVGVGFALLGSMSMFFAIAAGLFS